MREEWDAFVRESRNGTFLFERAYMDHHADRFADASLLVRDGKGALLTLLPGNVEQGTFVSHGGLTYGGLVLGSRMGAELMRPVFASLLASVFRMGVERIVYKPVPHVYHREPSEEDLWALHCAGARLLRRDVSSAVFGARRLPLQERRARGRKKALAAGLIVEESSDWAGFWEVLAANLRERHHVQPVHTLEEITLLSARFAGMIRLFAATLYGAIQAGAVIFETDNVAKVQYIASVESGRQNGALDLLFGHLLDADFAAKEVFDFGTSMDPATGGLNAGNCAFKEGFGARTIVYDTYVLERGKGDAFG
jgi:hypothetical protein